MLKWVYLIGSVFILVYALFVMSVEKDATKGFALIALSLGLNAHSRIMDMQQSQPTRKAKYPFESEY
jgi:hypothetical protein